MQAKPLTREMKAEIKAAADAAGMEYTIKGNCRGCYEKILLRLWESVEVEAIESADGWVMKDPKHSFRTFSGELWTNADMAGREVAGLHPNIRDNYFVKKEAGE